MNTQMNLNPAGDRGPAGNPNGCMILMIVSLAALLLTGCCVFERYNAPYSGAELENVDGTE